MNWDRSVIDYAEAHREQVERLRRDAYDPNREALGEYGTTQIPDEIQPEERQGIPEPLRTILFGLAIAAGFYVLIWSTWELLLLLYV